MKPQYRICPDCGASLDPQEVCDCKENEIQRLREALEKKSDEVRELIWMGIRKDARIRELAAELEGVRKRAAVR